MVRTNLNLRVANSIDVSHPALSRSWFLRKAIFIINAAKYMVVDGAVRLKDVWILHLLLLERRRAWMSAANLYLLTALTDGGSPVVLT